MPALAPVLFGVSLALSLLAGFMALYARDVRRDRGATRRFAAVGAVATVTTVAIGWWWL